MPLDLSRARRLAPLSLENHRSIRYSGDSLCSSMQEFASEDQEIIVRMYKFLAALFSKVTPPPNARDLAGPLKEVMREHSFYRLVDEVRVLGVASHVTSPQEPRGRTVHDLRGGAMTSLVGHLDALVDQPDEALISAAIFPLVRDHLKIMRNSLHDLDPERRQNDLKPRGHSIDLMVEKWQQSAYGPTDRQVAIQVECFHPHGVIAECCVESAAIDRIMYNMMNNAVRHTAEGRVQLLIIPVPEESTVTSLRFAIANEVSPEEAESLLARHEERPKLPGLFTSGVSSTGSGLGLAIAAEFVAQAYGLPHVHDAVAEGYVGAEVVEQKFVAWFHWPISHWQENPAQEKQIQMHETI